MGYGFGIIGLGLIADFHARAVQAMKNGELLACCSRSQDKADAFGEKFQCTGYSSLKEFLAHPGLDVVTICTPSGAHLDPSLAAIESGKHIIVEKPLEITLNRCDEIIEAGRRKSVTIAGIFPSRFYEVVHVVKHAVDRGRFGSMVLGDAYVKWFRSQAYYDEGGWKGTLKFDGGGALMNQSIHAVDLLQWFMGPVDSVQAFIGTLGHERIEVEDVAVAALHFKNGALGVIEGSTAVYPGFLKRIEISGTEGSAVLEEENLKEWIFSEEAKEDEEIRRKFSAKPETGGGAADPAAIGFHGHQKQFEDMVEALDKGKSPLVDGAEARKAVEIILAIYKSSKQGRPVKLPL